MRHNPASLGGAVLLPVLASTTVGAAPPPVWFSGMGHLADGHSSLAYGLSADGTTAMGQADVAGVQLPVRWSLAEGVRSLGTLPGTGFSIARKASADGSVIVGQSNGRAFRWTNNGGAGGTITDLIASAGGDTSNFSSAWGVSADGGAVVGTASFTSGFNAFRWTQDTGLTNLGFFDGSSLSADGRYFTATGSGANGAILAYRSDGTTTNQIPHLPSLADITQPRGISGDGRFVVGYSFINTGTTNTYNQAFIWSALTGTVGLQDLPGGGPDSDAYAITDDGGIVVGSSFGSAGTTATLWLHGVPQAMNSYLAGHGVTGLTGWFLTSATAVTPDGLTFAGMGVNPAGLQEGWVAHIPAPGAGVPLMAAVVTTLRRRNRRG